MANSDSWKVLARDVADNTDQTAREFEAEGMRNLAHSILMQSRDELVKHVARDVAGNLERAVDLSGYANFLRYQAEQADMAFERIGLAATCRPLAEVARF